MIKRTLTALSLLTVTAFVVAGCGGGGGKDISTVKSCLKKAKFTTESATKKDKDVEEGVSGMLANTSKPDELAIALAATVKETKDVKKFQKQVDDLTDQLKKQDKDKYQFKNGVDGKYVWVVAGVKKSKAFDKGLDCVQP
ncbi:MAG: hypothetical protein JWN72_1545 [Thermoleophilia bacterium]|nr:hypothetical protein [Thermoleophilia bacterium]